CLPDREHLRRTLVGDLPAVGVLELLHQRVEIERVRFEVLPEPGGFLDALGIDLQLVGQVRADHSEDLLAFHWPDTVAAASDEDGSPSAASPGLRSAPASW